MQVDEDPSKEPNTEEDLKCVNGTLELKGTYQVHGKEGYYQVSECHSVIAHNAKLELFAPLVFNSTSLEFEGHLTVVAKKPMAVSCLRFAGQVVISGDISMKDCHNYLFADLILLVHNSVKDWHTDENGGGIYAVNLILQKSGKITIENCSSKRHGGAIYVKDSFTQEGGDMMIHNCQAGYQGGAVYAENNFTQNNGALRVEDCSASDGGALRAGSFRQTGGNVSLFNCKAEGYGGDGGSIESRFLRALAGKKADGGGLYAGGFEQMGGWMMIHSCEAKKAGGGLRIWDKIFRQDGELHVRQCSAQEGGALYLPEAPTKVEQGKSATALVEARQLEATVPSQISGPHTQLVTHKHI